MVLVLAIAALNVACAGPSTPFGALESQVGENSESEHFSKSDQASKSNEHFLPRLQVSPDRQVLHDHMDVTVAIEDRQGFSKNAKLQVEFNGRPIKVDSQILIPPDNGRMAYVAYRGLFLRPDRQNEIKFSYKRDSRAKPVEYDLAKPDCSFSGDWPVQSLGPFKISDELRSEIESQAKQQKVNPALLFGLIAQESAFNPNAISWAKAIGLTQVTPIGDRQIAKTYPNWPRSPKVSELPSSLLKILIQSGELSEDWRLQPKLSIQGGLTLLKEMNSYWYKKEVPVLLSDGELPPAVNDLTLASYHSGALRVYEAIQEKGLSYLDHENLGEAKKYVNRVKSYCYHFANAPKRKVASR
ncbi:MAG: transglycosylase SLT domain-containing protein [Bdellovibrionales bacterium]|nr:transglycosylase SLT domain-containing protein [Bdellovibrionales bacterium]